MPVLTVHLTALQIGEIAHKLGIVADEPDLQDSYEVSEDEARQLADFFRDAKAEPEWDVLPDLQAAAARKWSGSPACQQAGLFARAAATEMMDFLAGCHPDAEAILPLPEEDRSHDSGMEP